MTKLIITIDINQYDHIKHSNLTKVNQIFNVFRNCQFNYIDQCGIFYVKMIILLDMKIYYIYHMCEL